MFYTFDPQGSVAQRLDGGGNMLGSYVFDAYGARQGSDSTTDPYAGFGGQYGYYTDSDTSLQLLRHRYYDSTTGRFLTRDPLGYSGGMNLYAYIADNPVNDIDPLGFAGQDAHHSFPKFMGGDENQKLTNMSEAEHDALHSDLNNFLETQTNGKGNHMRPVKGNPKWRIQDNFSLREREDAMGRFYRGPGSKYMTAARDFFRQCPRQSPKAIAAERENLAETAAAARAEFAEGAEALDVALIAAGLIFK